ncbi:hypothetical protein BJP34_17805 [Moorena producens PAL-8-15-08-1]|uniref:Uncharacterized protein n=1 Tax=Moorena producens PAL-8-15-08-1 TaxID=1458985 RepID=A0A1D8TTV4_9CYAN|nr:hypothetical protein BJP34_17805 [Moorena producens PAL-8-15-08-1]
MQVNSLAALLFETSANSSILLIIRHCATPNPDIELKEGVADSGYGFAPLAPQFWALIKPDDRAFIP